MLSAKRSAANWFNLTRACLQLSGDDSASELNCCEENVAELVAAYCDGSKVFKFIEEALDEVAFVVEREIASSRRLAIGLWGIHRG